MSVVSADEGSLVNGVDAPDQRLPSDAGAFAGVLGHGARITQAIRKAHMLASVDTPLLLQGETGVGKEVFARSIHNGGPQRSGPFVALNCGGMPRELLASELFGYAEGAFTGARRSGAPGKLEAANEGSLFLDEISEMPLELQPYLLRVLEGGEVYPLGSNKPRRVRFRLLAACNRDLREEAFAGRFRVDLYYRVSVTVLQIPPLRERAEDIPLLVEHFAREVAERHGIPIKCFASEVFAAFSRYGWPGNIRELRNVVESMVLLAQGESVDASGLPPHFREVQELPSIRLAGDEQSGLRQVERAAITEVLRASGGNLTKAARELRVARSTLYLKLRKYALEELLNDVRSEFSGMWRSGSHEGP